jgi:hypothetical protein
MVRRYAHRSILSLLLLCLLAGCSGTPVASKPSQAIAVAPKAAVPKTAEFLAAQRFMKSWGAGELIQTAMHREMEKTAAQQPGMAELMQRALADSSADDFTDLAAGVYARHVNQADLESLASFSETPAGNRFFKSVVTAVLAGEKIDQNAIMRQFNADELTEILKFSQSPAFASMQAKLPTINKEMGEEGRKYGEQKLKEYLKRK